MYLSIWMQARSEIFICVLSGGTCSGFRIDRFLYKCRAASKKIGGVIRYTIIICGKESFLFHGGNKLFAEAKEDSCS